MLKVPYGQDPYSVIGKYIRNHITVIEDIIATIEIDGIRTNELFMVDTQEDVYFVWKSDWYEGEKDVALIDFFPVSEAINPSAQPEPKWTPCSKRLPDTEDCPMDCLVTRKSKYIGNYTDMAVCEKNGTWTHEDWDAIVLGDVEDGKSTGLISTRDDDIIAWMPLPEPWKEGEQG